MFSKCQTITAGKKQPIKLFTVLATETSISNRNCKKLSPLHFWAAFSLGRLFWEWNALFPSVYCCHSPGCLASPQAATSPLYIQRVIRVKRIVSVRGNNCSLNYSYSLRSKTIWECCGVGSVRENGIEFSSSCRGTSSFSSSNLGMILYNHFPVKSIWITVTITIVWGDEYLREGQEKNLRSASVCLVGAAFCLGEMWLRTSQGQLGNFNPLLPL